jgi:hypothetical protein
MARNVSAMHMTSKSLLAEVPMAAMTKPESKFMQMDAA